MRNGKRNLYTTIWYLHLSLFIYSLFFHTVFSVVYRYICFTLTLSFARSLSMFACVYVCFVYSSIQLNDVINVCANPCIKRFDQFMYNVKWNVKFCNAQDEKCWDSEKAIALHIHAHKHDIYCVYHSIDYRAYMITILAMSSQLYERCYLFVHVKMVI